MNDRLVAGALAGTIAGVIQNLYSCAAKALGFVDLTFCDFAQAVVLYNPKPGMATNIVSVVAHLVWDALLGVAFAHFIRTYSSRFYYAKALFFSLALWFFIHAIGNITRLPAFFNNPARAALMTLTGALLYGYVLAYVLKFCEKKGLV